MHQIPSLEAASETEEQPANDVRHHPSAGSDDGLEKQRTQHLGEKIKSSTDQ